MNHFLVNWDLNMKMNVRIMIFLVLQHTLHHFVVWELWCVTSNLTTGLLAEQKLSNFKKIREISEKTNLLLITWMKLMFGSLDARCSALLRHGGPTHGPSHRTQRWDIWVHYIQRKWHQGPDGVWTSQTNMLSASGPRHCSGISKNALSY